MGNRVGSCGRTAAEIRYIQASLELFAQLPPERREAVRATIARVAATPEEGMALFRLSKNATREDVETAVKILEALRSKHEST